MASLQYGFLWVIIYINTFKWVTFLPFLAISRWAFLSWVFTRMSVRCSAPENKKDLTPSDRHSLPRSLYGVGMFTTQHKKPVRYLPPSPAKESEGCPVSMIREGRGGAKVKNCMKWTLWKKNVCNGERNKAKTGTCRVYKASCLEMVGGGGGGIISE